MIETKSLEIYRFTINGFAILFKAKNDINAIRWLDEKMDLGSHCSFTHLFYNLNSYVKYECSNEIKNRFYNDEIDFIFKMVDDRSEDNWEILSDEQTQVILRRRK